MHSRYHWALLAAVLAVNTSAFGQEKTEKNEPKPDPNIVEIRVADDSTVKMVLQHGSIEVATRYGKLSVPVNEIRRIDFGLRIPGDTARRIDAAIGRLGSPDYKQREAAGAELLELRELAYPALQLAARSTDAEVSRRAKEALKLLTETVPAEKLHLPRHDTIVALDFTIIGQVEAPVLKGHTPHFGDVSLKLAELRSMRCLANEREAKLAVDAARYGGQQEAWMDTGIQLRAGANVQIAAGGMVDLRPATEAGTYLAGPDGMVSSRSTRGAPGGPGGRGGAPAVIRPSTSTQSPGALVGRIGEYGKIFVVGSRFDGTAGEEGKLYLRIVASPYGEEASGSYDVRLTTGR